MTELTFSTTSAWNLTDGFGCASLGIAGVCDNSEKLVTRFGTKLKGVVISGQYSDVLNKAAECRDEVFAAIVLFGNAGGENVFLADFQKVIHCPMVGGGAAIDGATGRSALLTGGGQVAVFLITDDRFTYEAVTQCVHENVIGEVCLTTADPRTILTIDGIDAAEFLATKRMDLGLSKSDFEHLTISDYQNVNAHLSCVDGIIKSGRDVHDKMILRYVDHAKVYEAMRNFYDDENAIVFGCAGLSGLLDKPLNTASLGLFLFGEVCTVDGIAEFGNLMLSKLVIKKR